MALAALTDVENRWRLLEGQERTVARALLEEAEALLAVSVPGIRDRAAASSDVALAARSVVVSMVLRVLRNPGAVRQFTVDDYSEVRDQVASSGLLHATPEELAQVTPRPGPLPPVFVMDLGG